MYVYQIFWADRAAAPNCPAFSMVETEFPTIKDLFDHLQSGGLVAGSELDTHWGDEMGERVIHRRRPVVFGAASVARLNVPTWRIVEGENAEAG